MKQIAIIPLLLLYTLALRAHTPQISSIALIQSKENKWNLVISASLSAFQYEWMNSYPTQKMDSISADLFQAMIVRHLKKKIAIHVNGQLGTLQNGKVILGHQTDINFDVSGMPVQLHSLELQQSGFATLRDHYCILKVITKDNDSKNFILQHGNNFSISLGINGKVFSEKSPKKSYHWLLLSFIAIGLLFVSTIAHKYPILAR